MLISIAILLFTVKRYFLEGVVMVRQLKEIAREILEKKFSKDPNKMAAALGLDLMYVRRAVGLAALDGTTQQKTFEFTLKLLPICKELGIDPAQELKAPTDQEVLHEIEPDGKKTRRDAKKRKRGHATAAFGPLQARGVKGGRR